MPARVYCNCSGAIFLCLPLATAGKYFFTAFRLTLISSSAVQAFRFQWHPRTETVITPEIFVGLHADI